MIEEIGDLLNEGEDFAIAKKSDNIVITLHDFTKQVQARYEFTPEKWEEFKQERQQGEASTEEIIKLLRDAIEVQYQSHNN